VSELPVAEFLQGLREAHETYKHLVEGIPASLYVDAVDDLSTNLYTSPQIQTLLGFTVQEWTEDPNLWIARMHEDDRERVVRAHQESNRTGGPFNTEYRVYARDGSVVWVHDEAVLVRDENGEPMYWRGIMSDLSKQKQAEEKLRKSLDVLRRTMEDRRQLLLRLEDAQEEERRRIAADIHDDSVQAMAAVGIRLELLARRVGDDATRTELEALRSEIAAALAALRELVFRLTPASLERAGLKTALAEATARLKLRGGPTFEIGADLSREPSMEIRVVLFRIAQEALLNARRHARAHRVRVRLTDDGDGFRLEVSDDGRGFAMPANHALPTAAEHFGIATMTERAELAGGWLTLRSAPAAGTTVTAWVPDERLDDAGSAMAAGDPGRSDD